MLSLTIQNLDEGLQTQLQLLAAQHGHSMEDEVRDILRSALVGERAPVADLAASIRAKFVPLGGVELPLPIREAIRLPTELER